MRLPQWLPLVGSVVLGCAASSPVVGTPAAAPTPAPVATAPAATAPSPVAATPPGTAAVSIDVNDLTPKFLAFFDAASKDGVTPDERWDLWRSMYDFAAVPPGPRGDAMARKLLDEAWPKYPVVLDRVRTQPAIIAREARGDVERIAALLQLDRPLAIRLVLYVGALETNAFTYVDADGRPHVAIPVEGPPEQATLLAAHELTHAVHLPLARLPGGWERSIAQTVLAEGLAMRVVKRLYPGRPDEAYTEATPGWLREASARRDGILRGIRPFLAARDGATVGRFTMGRGTTGIEREAYYAGWLVVGHLLERGQTFAQIARVPEDRLVDVVGEALDDLLHG